VWLCAWVAVRVAVIDTIEMWMYRRKGRRGRMLVVSSGGVSRSGAASIAGSGVAYSPEAIVCDPWLVIGLLSGAGARLGGVHAGTVGL